MNGPLTNEEVIHVVHDNVQYLQFRKLLQYDNILAHAITLKEEGPITKAVTYQDLQMDVQNKVIMRQIHSDIVKIADIQGMDIGEADGSMTNRENVVLSSVEADCIPMIFFDPIKKVIANVHSGWKGTLKQISKKTAIMMHERFCTNYKDIICAIGPSIRICHFEVDEDVKKLYEKEFKNYDGLIKLGQIKDGKQKYYIDTVLANKIMLKELGIDDKNIIDSNICTVCNSKYVHSYRVEKENYLRNNTLVCLRRK